MVLQQKPEMTVEAAPKREVASGSSADVAVEPVETVRGDSSRDARVPLAVHVERLRRLALEVRVVALEDELERAEWRCEQVIERYEQVIAERDDGETETASPTFSWLPRP